MIRNGNEEFSFQCRCLILCIEYISISPTYITVTDQWLILPHWHIFGCLNDKGLILCEPYNCQLCYIFSKYGVVRGIP